MRAYLTSAAIVCCAMCAAAPAPVAVWHFDEPAGTAIYDSTGNGYDGRLKNAARVPGLFGQALQFSGAESYAQLKSPGGMSEGTIEAWANVPAKPQGQVGVVTFGMGAGNKNDVAVLGLPLSEKGAAGKWGFGICPEAWRSALSDQDLPLNRWVHLVGSWGPAGLKYYVDGKPAASDPTMVGPMPGHGFVLIGAGSWNAYMQCTVDEVRLYDRQLDDLTVAQHVADRSYAQTPPQTSPQLAAGPRSVVEAGKFYNADSPSSGLQEAIDSLGKHGGIVEIPPGTYFLRRSLRLKSNTTLRGAGAATILKKLPEVMSPLTKPGKVGDTTVEVKDASGFKVGTEIAVMDDQMRGWYMTHAIVRKIEGHTITLDVALQKDMALERNALAITYFPAIWIEHQSDCVIEGLSFDGDMDDQPSQSVTCFTLAAIHLVGCDRCQVSDCRVNGWPGDGIGVQGGEFDTVSGCVVTGCRGHGYHPGTSIRDSVWTDLVGYANGWDGLYFCADCQGVTVSNSIFDDNGWSGIGGLGDGNDKYDTVIGNTCRRNRACGITMATSGHNTVTGNLCLDNGRSDPGHLPGIKVKDTTDNIITNNRCMNTEQPGMQKCGIEESGSSDGNLITGNYCKGNVGPGVVVVGKATVATDNVQ